MPVEIHTNSVTFGNTAVPFEDFGRLIERHLSRYPNTPNLESEGSQLRSLNFAEHELELFIRHVCKWGGYPGIAGRIVKQNSMVMARERFRSAMMKLEANVTDVGGALREVNYIRGLGTPSFASKHLRFLHPELCPILDGIIANRLNYPFNVHGYQALSSDCGRIADLLQHSQIQNPRHRGGNKWYISDVEMAMFSYLNEL